MGGRRCQHRNWLPCGRWRRWGWGRCGKTFKSAVADDAAVVNLDHTACLRSHRPVVRDEDDGVTSIGQLRQQRHDFCTTA